MFYLDGLNTQETSIVLTGDEAKHAVAVRRLKQGEEVSITNGRGLTGFGKVTESKMRPPRLSLSIDRFETEMKKVHIHLAAALPKGDRQRVMLDMATQAGMDCFTPLISQRTVSKEGKHAVEKWQRICLEAMKQSRRSWMPVVQSAASLKDFLDSVSSTAQIFVASISGKTVRQLPSADPGAEVVILVGPEGGFTDSELTLIQKAGAIELSLGQAVLRTETAAVLATAMIASLVQGC